MVMEGGRMGGKCRRGGLKEKLRRYNHVLHTFPKHVINWTLVLKLKDI